MSFSKIYFFPFSIKTVKRFQWGTHLTNSLLGSDETDSAQVKEEDEEEPVVKKSSIRVRKQKQIKEEPCDGAEKKGEWF